MVTQSPSCWTPSRLAAWALIGSDEAVPPPTHRRQPRARPGDGCALGRSRRCVAPAGEPARRGAAIDTLLPRGVFLSIRQHVPDTLHTKPRFASFTTAGIRG